MGPTTIQLRCVALIFSLNSLGLTSIPSLIGDALYAGSSRSSDCIPHPNYHWRVICVASTAFPMLSYLVVIPQAFGIARCRRSSHVFDLDELLPFHGVLSTVFKTSTLEICRLHAPYNGSSKLCSYSALTHFLFVVIKRPRSITGFSGNKYIHFDMTASRTSNLSNHRAWLRLHPLI